MQTVRLLSDSNFTTKYFQHEFFTTETGRPFHMILFLNSIKSFKVNDLTPTQENKQQVLVKTITEVLQSQSNGLKEI